MVIRLGPEREETAFTHLLRKSLYILYNILNSQPVICNVIYTFRIFARFWKISFKFFLIWAVKFQDIFKCSWAVTNLKYSCKHLKVELKSIRSILRSHFYSGTVSNWIIRGGDYQLHKYIQTPEIHTKCFFNFPVVRSPQNAHRDMNAPLCMGKCVKGGGQGVDSQ